MTEQPPPQVIQPPTIGGPLVPPEQAPPPPVEEAPPGDGMRFMVRIQDNPDLPNYNQPQSLHRFKITPEEIVTDRFDADAKMWVDNPGMLAFTGIGGAEDFVEIDIDNANALISQWLGESFISGQPSEEGAPEETETVEVTGKAIKRIVIRNPGGEGSGFFDHAGRPGEVGGSQPESGGKRQVGITTARPGKLSSEVFEQMRDFEAELKQITGVGDVSVQPGLGGWEGGRESTWVVSFSGNGEAEKLIAKIAKANNQDGVLFMDPCAPPPDCSPVVDFHFSDPVTPSERDAVEQMMVSTGIGGWTWYKREGAFSSLRAVAVPQWGGEAESHLESANTLQSLFRLAGMPHEFQTGEVAVSVMNKEGENSYDEYLQ